MQNTILIYQSLGIIIGQHYPFVLQSTHLISIIRLYRTEIVECGELERQGVLGTRQFDDIKSGDGLVGHYPSVDLCSCIYVSAIHLQFYKLWMEQDVISLHNTHFHWVKRQHMVECLHYYRTVIQTHCPTIDECLGRNTIRFYETVDKGNLAVLHYKSYDTIARAHPHIVLSIFNNGMYNIIHHSFFLFHADGVLLSWFKIIQTVKRTYPYPSSAVLVCAIKSVALDK